MSSDATAGPSLKDVEKTSAEFGTLASEVSEKLKAFLEWLNGLPGHTDVEIFGPAPDQSERSFDLLGLRIARGKNGWELFYSTASDRGFGETSQTDEWKQVENAPLDLRCAALSLLPTLIEKMHLEQRRLVERLRSAKSVLDTLPIARKRLGKEGA